MGVMLQENIGDAGLVCRYGGEEFVVLVPNVPVETCVEMADDLRKLIETTETCGINFTASIGVSSKTFKPMDPQHLLDQADESLYNAKRSGRNRVIRYDQQAPVEDEEGAQTATQTADPAGTEIPYSAVTGLLSALAFRCRTTAEHSIRVADLCVAVGERLMNKRELYRLEIAALLHDIGKIGVPDNILHKPGPLTELEWDVMRKHDEIGVEIVRSAFASEAIAVAIESHHHSFSVRNQAISQEMLDQSVPLIGRIITVCDAYDAMTNDRVYRKALSIEDSLNEIRKHTPSQFDPIVVEILINHVESGCYQPRKSNPAAPLQQTQPRSAAAIGQHIEELYQAIANENVSQLRSVVDELKRDAHSTEDMSLATERLDDMISNNADDLDQVLVLANEVIDLCRSSRSTFVDAAETITGPGVLSPN